MFDFVMLYLEDLIKLLPCLIAIRFIFDILRQLVFKND